MASKAHPLYSLKVQKDGWTVMRDDEPLKTPRNLAVTVPTEKLAEALIHECVGQGDKLDLRKMPMTQMTLTALDIASHHREEVITGIMRHGETELLCQRASEPEDLVQRQNKTWQPYLDWCAQTFKAELSVATGITPPHQKPEALEALRHYLEGQDDYRIIGISEAVGICGSLVLGLALATSHADIDAIFAAAECDVLWQAQKWGQDPATEGRLSDIKRELNDCIRWFELVKTNEFKPAYSSSN
jgi:chaperone required for assembly of F1-ATPase